MFPNRNLQLTKFDCDKKLSSYNLPPSHPTPLFILWNGVTIHWKAVEQYFTVVLFVFQFFLCSLRALHFASRYGHLPCVETLLELGADVDAEDRRGWQAIHEAALHGRVECLEKLLRNGASPNAVAYNGNGPSTPLHYAARHGHLQCVKVLLRYGADWSMGNEYGETPLHCTAMRGHVDCMKALAEAGDQTCLLQCPGVSVSKGKCALCRWKRKTSNLNCRQEVDKVI